MVGAAGSNQTPKVTTSKFTFNASTGGLSVTGDVSAFVSDDRLKNKNGLITNAISKVMTLDAFYYTLNDFAINNGYKEHKDIQHVGLSAQQVEEVLPEVVSNINLQLTPPEGEPSYKTIKYDKIVPLLIAAIQELSAEVDKLKEKLKEK
jgi:hypothetical protein